MAAPDISTPSLHDALPICIRPLGALQRLRRGIAEDAGRTRRHGLPAHRLEAVRHARRGGRRLPRSEEHTSELQSLRHLVCRLLLEKKKKHNIYRQTLPTEP